MIRAARIRQGNTVHSNMMPPSATVYYYLDLSNVSAKTFMSMTEQITRTVLASYRRRKKYIYRPIRI